MRAGEAHQLRWADLDLVNFTIRVIPEKHSNPRVFKLGNRLISMINRLPKDHSTLFGSSKLNHLRRTYTQRKRQPTNSATQTTANNISHTAPLESNNGISKNQKHTACNGLAWSQKHRKHPSLHPSHRL
jgi:integrase